MKTRFCGFSVVLADEIAACDVLVEDGKIIALLRSDEPLAEVPQNIVKAKLGEMLLPAFADMHAHFRDPGFLAKETIETGSRAAAAGGYTLVQAMANTSPPIWQANQIAEVESRAAQLGLIDLIQLSAVTEEMQGENLIDFASLPPHHVFVSEDGKGIQRDALMAQALKQAKQHDKIILIHAESTGFGIAESRTAEDLMTMRDIYLAKAASAAIHLTHVSTKFAIEAIRQAKREGVKVTCDVTPHHLCLSDNDYRVNPSIRNREDVEAIWQGLCDGTVDAIATDHAPHTAADKAKGSPGMIGLELAFSICNTTLVKRGILTLPQLAKLMSLKPRRLMKRAGGAIEVGVVADFAIVNPDKVVQYEASRLQSKCCNTPFLGKPLFGEVIATYRNGQKITGDKS